MVRTQEGRGDFLNVSPPRMHAHAEEEKDEMQASTQEKSSFLADSSPS